MKLTIPLRDGTNLTFEGTYDELTRFAERFVEKHGLAIAMSAGGTAAQPSEATRACASGRWTEQSVQKLWVLLYGDQAKLVRFLVERGGKAEYRELGQHMGYDGQRLSGILSPITRNAQTATGDRLARLVDWRITDDGRREYSLDSEALPLLQQIIPLSH